MAGSAMTFAYHEVGIVKKVVVDWTSDSATGAVSGTTKEIRGELLRGVTDPDGVAAPTDDYDIAITDEEGANVLANCFDDLTDRDEANVEGVDFHLTDGAVANGARPVVCDKLTIAVTAAGNSKQGRLVLYYRP